MTLSTRLLSCTMTLALAGGGIAVLAGPASARPHGADRGEVSSSEQDQAAKHEHLRMKFTAVGKVVAVDAAARTVKVKVKGGDHGLHRGTVTLAVATDAVVRRNGVLVGLDAVQPGDHVALKGTRGTDRSLTVTRMNVAGKATATSPAPTSSPTSSAAPTPTASAAPTPAPTTSPTTTPTPAPTSSSTPAPTSSPAP